MEVTEYSKYQFEQILCNKRRVDEMIGRLEGYLEYGSTNGVVTIPCFKLQRIIDVGKEEYPMGGVCRYDFRDMETHVDPDYVYVIRKSTT